MKLRYANRIALPVLLIAALACLFPISTDGADKPDSKKPDLGVNASFHGHRLMPADSPWNKDISKSEVDPNSAALIASIGADKGLHPDFGTTYNGAPNGIPYVIVAGNQPKIELKFTDYPDESDKGPYPIPLDAPVEGGLKADGDRHVIVYDRDNDVLYEMWRAFPEAGGKWKSANGAIFDLKGNKQRPQGWTSADAAGLPILPGLVRYDEVGEEKAINHAIRFTIKKSRRAYVPPATHWASKSDDHNLPPMGMRVRLKENIDPSKYPESVRPIIVCLKKYGMIVADNGGDWFISGAPDPRWNDDELNSLKKIKGKDFEVIKMDGLIAAKK